jgi:predicted CXXCH cytochrome family protein
MTPQRHRLFRAAQLAIYVCLAAGLAAWAAEIRSVAATDESTPAAPTEQRPPLPPQLGDNPQFASSSRCRDCHQGEFDSWHRTFHRTMTQAASPTNFVGRFDGSTIDSAGMKYQVFRRGETFWARMPDPDVMLDRQRRHEYLVQRGLASGPIDWSGVPEVERQVVMSTGSHRYQTYWVESARFPGTLMTLPLVWLIQDERWIPRESAFVTPPDGSRMVTVWNDHCIKCHSTGGAPLPFVKHDANGHVAQTGFRTQVGEVGIACEACHGAAEEHVSLRRREAAGEGGLAELLQADPIVQPAKLGDHRRSAEICGQCHGVFVWSEEQGARYRDGGGNFRPGEELLAKRDYLFPPQDAAFYASEREQAAALQDYQRNRQFFRARFWENGTVLAGGREFTALAVTACYRQGALSCLSCHSMHKSEPSGQLKPGMRGSEACTQCHGGPEYTTDVSRHTHHLPDSAGSNCLNCHMPHTAYALFAAIRNHQIAPPDLAGSVQHGVPNACNLCHLDQTLAWTQRHLVDWYGYEPLPMTTEQAHVAAALVWMLKGNAAQRVVTVWHAGWGPALEASGADWLTPFVSRLLEDPYGVVRYVAEHALRRQEGLAAWKYNFLAPPAELQAAGAALRKNWAELRQGLPSRRGKSVLIDDQGRVSAAAVEWLLKHRDDQPITISE